MTEWATVFEPDLSKAPFVLQNGETVEFRLVPPGRRINVNQTQHADHFAMFLAFFRPAVGDGQAKLLEWIEPKAEAPTRTEGDRILGQLAKLSRRMNKMPPPEHVFYDGVHIANGKAHAMGDPDCAMCQSYERG